MKPNPIGLIAAMVVGFLVLDFSATRSLRAADDFSISLIYGLLIGQVNLIGVWAAFAPGTPIVRLPWAGLLALLVWYAGLLGAETLRDSQAAVETALAMTFGVVVVQIPLWATRWKFGWRLLSPSVNAKEVYRLDGQFNLKHLLVGSAIMSVGLGLARTVLDADEAWLRAIRNGEMFVVLGIAAMANIVATSPCIWLALCRTDRLWRFGILVWPIVVLVVTVLEMLLLSLFAGPPPGSEVIVMIFLLNLTQCLVVFGSLLLLRWVGFSLVRLSTLAEEEPHSQVA